MKAVIMAGGKGNNGFILAPCVPGILATLPFLDMQGCPFLLCNFFQKGFAKNTI